MIVQEARLAVICLYDGEVYITLIKDPVGRKNGAL
jgi:hypothetical protein